MPASAPPPRTPQSAPNLGVPARRRTRRRARRRIAPPARPWPAGHAFHPARRRGRARGHQVVDVGFHAQAAGLERRARLPSSIDVILPVQPPRTCCASIPTCHRTGRGPAEAGRSGAGTFPSRSASEASIAVEAPLGERLALQRPPDARDLGVEVRPPGRSASARTCAERSVSLAPGPRALLLGLARASRRAPPRRGHAPGPRPSRACWRLDRCECRPRTPAARATAASGHRRPGSAAQAQTLGDGERLARARQADREVVGRAERLQVEVDRGVHRAAACCARRSSARRSGSLRRPARRTG